MSLRHWTQRERGLLFAVVVLSVVCFCLFITATVLGERARKAAYELDEQRSKTTLSTPVPTMTTPTTNVSSSEPSSEDVITLTPPSSSENPKVTTPTPVATPATAATTPTTSATPATVATLSPPTTVATPVTAATNSPKVNVTTSSPTT